MKAKTKKLWLLTAVLFAFVSFTAMYTASQLASAYTVPELSIVNGASVRVVDTSDNETAKESNGLRFATYMDKVEYETLMKQTDVTDVKFGVLIAPDTATYVLNKDTVFSTDPTVKKYDWAVFNTTTGNWDYSGDGTYTRIMNFTSDVLYENTAIGTEDNVYFTGSIVGIKPENLANEWQGIGYMSYVENGAVKYQFTDKVVRSMAYTAQLAIDDTSEKAPDADQKAWLQKYYVNEVTDVATTYSTEYYVEQKDGTFALKETVSTDATIDDVATPGEAKEIAGYVYDAENLNNALDGNKVLANGKLVYKRYYLMTEVGLVDKSSETDKNSVRTLDGYTATVNKVIGRTATPVENATFVDGVLDVSSLDGTYNLVLTKGEKTLTRIFDVYDSTQAPEWLNTLSMDNFFGFRATSDNSQNATYRNKALYSTSLVALDEQFHRGNFYFIDGSKGGANDAAAGINLGTPWSFNVIAKHSKAYYERFTDYVLTYDYYLGSSDSYGNKLFFAAFSDKQDSSGREVGWYNVSVPMATILEKWDAINDLEAVTGHGNGMLTSGYETKYYNYLGNFKVVADYPSTPAETPIWNNTTNGWDARVYQNGSTWKESAWSVGYMDRILSVDATTTDTVGGRTSGNYLMVTPVNSIQWHYFALKPVYEKAVYEDYLALNPNATLEFEFYYTLPSTAKNDVRRISTNTNYYNILSGSWYTVQVSLQYLVTNWDNIANDTANNGGRIFSINGNDEGYNSWGNDNYGNQATDRDTTSQQITIFVGNFKINSTGTVGFVKQA